MPPALAQARRGTEVASPGEFGSFLRNGLWNIPGFFLRPWTSVSELPSQVLREALMVSGL